MLKCYILIFIILESFVLSFVKYSVLNGENVKSKYRKLVDNVILKKFMKVKNVIFFVLF